MNDRLRKSLTYSLLTTAVASTIIYYLEPQIMLPLFAVILFAVTFAIAYWVLFAAR